MESNSFRQQVRRSSLSLISIVIALSALFYNTWRNELTEANRNIRVAEFEILKALGEVQQVIDYAHFRRDQQRADLTLCLARVLLIHDLATLAPAPVPASSDKLLAAWRTHGESITTSLESASAMSEEVLEMQRVVLASLRTLK